MTATHAAATLGGQVRMRKRDWALVIGLPILIVGAATTASRWLGGSAPTVPGFELPERRRIEIPPATGEEAEALGRALARAGVRSSVVELLHRGDEVVYGIVTDGAHALEQWETLRDAAQDTGRYPVIIGDADALSMVLEVAEDTERGPAEILERAAELDTDAWLAERLETLAEDFPEPRGEWPVPLSTREARYAIPFEVLTGRPLPQVAIALVPTTRSWEAPAWLAYGAWNDCPEPAVHVALMKRWYDRYGAEVVGMSHDVVEMRVRRPPDSRPAALALAREHYAYAYDVVTQGTESLDALGAQVLGHGVWFFWWD